MWSFSRLCPIRSLAIISCSDLLRRRCAFSSLSHFIIVLIMVTYLKNLWQSWRARCSARLSTNLLLLTLKRAEIHWREIHLQLVVSCCFDWALCLITGQGTDHRQCCVVVMVKIACTCCLYQRMILVSNSRAPQNLTFFKSGLPWYKLTFLVLFQLRSSNAARETALFANTVYM